MSLEYGEAVLGGFLLIPLAGRVRYTRRIRRGRRGQLVPVLYDRFYLLEYPKGYPVPLCDVMVIVLLVLDDLVTLPGLPPLERRQAGQRGERPSVRNFSRENAIVRH